MLYFIGLGLGDVEDITVKGLRIVRKCDRIYLENYTSILTVGQEALEQFYERKLILADRELVEQNAEEILKDADVTDVAFLVVGDPFGATTHTDLMLRAREAGIPYEVVHNASIMNACGCCGLQLYSFGETVSIPFWTDTWEPDSFYQRIHDNKSRGLHTLCLLDIKVKEPTIESLTSKKRQYMPPKFMTVNTAAEQLLKILEKRSSLKQDISGTSYDKDFKCVALGRVGSPEQRIVYTSLEELQHIDLGGPLHSLIIPGTLQPLETEFLEQFTMK